MLNKLPSLTIGSTLSELLVNGGRFRTLISIYGKHGKLLFVIGWTDSWGELIETVVERAINATAIDLKEGPQEEDSWGKQPDWDLINRAVRRADGNRQG